ncbi:hypothetical protein CANARDRAFT_173572 [[Candida] arabinofermentans NRRL YB-2248]|uniref:HECT-type E3 ubiquitin transferase n=1 Tax=[Candida] arabinofermentans NRRL YB-2248 TaxID=983967 RepID=A0A1E4T7C0_9ASCO|nr:hypothetical protein CANARDRAFT_173572 [[Candida] arabinofermentans NRRL YB-2248]
MEVAFQRAEMSNRLNFTGTTRKKQVNLGNRSLGSRTQILQNAQLERSKRERYRKEQNASTTIQSAIRRFNDLRKWNLELSALWDGKDVKQFIYFFKNVVLLQDINQSLSQLKDISLQIYNTQYNWTPSLYETLANCLISAIDKVADLQTESGITLIHEMASLVDVICEAEIVNENNVKLDLFIRSMLKNYKLNGCVSLILKYGSSKKTLEFVTFFTKPEEEFILNINSSNQAGELVESFRCQLQAIIVNKKKFEEEFSDIQRFNYLMNIILLFYSTNATYFEIDEIFIKGFAILLDTLSCGLYFPQDDLYDEMQIDISNGASLQAQRGQDDVVLVQGVQPRMIRVEKHNYPYIEKLFYHFGKRVMKVCESTNASGDLLVSFFHALIQLACPPDSSYDINLKIKGDILLDMVVASSSFNFLDTWFSTLCDNDFYNETLVLVTEGSGNRFWVSAFGAESESWWNTLHLFQEVYSCLMYLSNDSDLFGNGRLDKENYMSFVSFLKNFCILTVLSGRTINDYLKDRVDSKILKAYKLVARLSLKLLKQINTRDLRMSLFDNDFWLMNSSFGFSFSSVFPVLALIEENHEDDTSSSGNNGIDLFEEGAKVFGRMVNPQMMNNLLIVTYLPFMIPFEMRAEIFHRLIDLDKTKVINIYDKRTPGTVSRGNVLQDSFDQFGHVSAADFKKQLSVEFINAFGEKEAGIDGGGLTKELLTSIIEDAFVTSNSKSTKKMNDNENFPYFKITSNYQFYPNPEPALEVMYGSQNKNSHYNKGELMNKLDMIKFLGMVIGKSIYENVLIDVSFAPFFLNRWTSSSFKDFLGFTQQGAETMQQRNSFDDLKTFDEELYDNLIKLTKLSESELDALDLTFTISEKIGGTVANVNLVPGGSNIKVTKKNRLQYIYATAKFKLDKSIATQSEYFLTGLFMIIKPQWLSLFNSYELTKLISGGEKEIDIEDLRKHIVLGGFAEDDQTIKDLFEILNEFSKEDKAKFVKFVTSSSKQPLLGFKELNPMFGVRNAGRFINRLPTASTCVNLLKLPDYQDKDVLREKLLYSINSQAGFDLS